jgi:protein tyrosine phosphatase (PTP) superfamily phosphohydrolase (DUF442 family)
LSTRLGHLKAIKFVLFALMSGGLMAMLVEIARMVLTNNKHEVLSGQVYRTAQLNADELSQFISSHHIRTVVNLRGRPIADWYVEESEVTQKLGVNQEDISLSASRLPAPNEIQRLIHVFDHAEYPIVMHCKQGSDRTGLASVIYLLLFTDVDYDTARRQCSPRYGHFPFLRRKEIDRFFDMYETWLGDRRHTPEFFRKWSAEEYQPGNAVAKLEFLPSKPAYQAGKPFTIKLRATNASREPWYFHESGEKNGVTVRYVVDGKDFQIVRRAGYTEHCVQPGHSIDIDLNVPSIGRCGPVKITADLSQWDFDFAQYGSSPISIFVNLANGCSSHSFK